jgi:mannosylglucosylglycerate synthase
MKALNIILLHYAGPPVIGGVESTLAHHAQMLAARQNHVQIIAGRGNTFHPDVGYTQLDMLDSSHPEIIQVGKELAKGIVSPFFDELRHQISHRLTPILQAADVVIVHNATTLHKNLPLTAALYDMAQNGLNLISWAHDFAWKDKLYTSSLHPGYPWNLLSQAWPNTRYVVVSADRQSILADLLNLPKSQITVITPGVDPVKFLQISPEVQTLISRLKLLTAAPLILLPARITRRKNIEFAVEVLAELVQKLPRARLVVTGPPGPHNPSNVTYLSRLKNQVQSYSLQDHVNFLYEMGHDDSPNLLSDRMVADLFRLADILFFPSQREGFGIPVLEAGLTRLPVFAANIPPVRESAGEFASLFDLDESAETVALRIANLLSSDKAYQLKQRVLSHFTWEAILEQKILPLIEEMSVL